MRSPNSRGQDRNAGKCVKKGPWSAEEDEKLKDYIKRYGIWNWTYMPKASGLARTGKSCRLRWMNYLRSNIRHGNFTREEEETIINWQRLLGNSRWSLIATKLPGRTDNDIKNYWNTQLKRLNLQNNGHVEKTIVEITTSQAMDSDEGEANTEINDNTSGSMATILIDNGTLKATLVETRDASTSSADSFCPSSSARSDITFQHGEEHASSLDVDDELQSFWEKLTPVEDLYSTKESIYMKSQDLIYPSYKLQEFPYPSDLFGEYFNFDVDNELQSFWEKVDSSGRFIWHEGKHLYEITRFDTVRNML